LGILILIVCLFTSFYVKRSIEIATFKIPMMNDAWQKSLVFIKDNTNKDAIINSWWDYGHWFKAIAQRKVLFDGKTQNSPVAYWMAKALITNDEDEAVGILRMLDISRNKAFELLDSYGLSHSKIVDTLLKAVKLSRIEAYQCLEEEFDKEKVEKVMPLLFNSNTPQACFIASYDMIGKMRAISHIGNWDFQKGEIWLHFLGSAPMDFLNYLKKEYGYTKEQISILLRDLKMLNDRDALGWISRASSINLDSVSNKFKKDNNLLIFDNGLVLDLSNFNAYLLRGQGVDIGIPYSVVYLENGALKETKLEKSNLDYSVLLLSDEKDSYKCIFLDKDLAKSMFVRMYFLKGEGLKYFKKLITEKTPEGNFIYTYNIEWPK
jgi:dolichyl-diphosphooligosaccharide--protein glycosyltransferase